MLITLKFVTIETTLRTGIKLHWKSMVLLLTTMENNLNSVLFVHHGNNLVSLAWPLFPHKTYKWFWKNSLVTAWKVFLKKIVQLKLKGTKFTEFHQYLTWEKKITLAQNSNFMQMKAIYFHMFKQIIISFRNFFLHL